MPQMPFMKDSWLDCRNWKIIRNLSIVPPLGPGSLLTPRPCFRTAPGACSAWRVPTAWLARAELRAVAEVTVSLKTFW